MKKTFILISILVAAAALIWGGIFYFRHLRGAGPAFRAPSQDITKLLGPQQGPPLDDWRQQRAALANLPLKLPEGFAISVFAHDLPGARVLALDPAGTLLVSLTRQGEVVALPDKDSRGVADRVVRVLTGLDQPHGLAFGGSDPPRLYVAETREVASYDYDPKTFAAKHKTKIIDLPPGGRHFTRTLLFLPPPQEQRLLIAVGSSCNACVEQDWRYAKILVADAGGANLKTFASGLRNSVFLAAHPVTRHIWATEMGRDYLGDDLPPDEINIIIEGGNYGWPWCYGKRVHDGQFDPRGTHKEFCKDTVPSYIDIPAHSSPLGLAFFPEDWPREYRYNLLVAYHGSWNRTVPTGYKVVRCKLDAQGNYLGVEDFISGWLTPDGALGRPVDLLIKPDGVIYISDDKAGVIYRVVYNRMMKK